MIKPHIFLKQGYWRVTALPSAYYITPSQGFLWNRAINRVMLLNYIAGRV